MSDAEYFKPVNCFINIHNTWARVTRRKCKLWHCAPGVPVSGRGGSSVFAHRTPALSQMVRASHLCAAPEQATSLVAPGAGVVLCHKMSPVRASV
jgi:hypothetical protein